jgi:hypothetical protein
MLLVAAVLVVLAVKNMPAIVSIMAAVLHYSGVLQSNAQSTTFVLVHVSMCLHA